MYTMHETSAQKSDCDEANGINDCKDSVKHNAVKWAIGDFRVEKDVWSNDVTTDEEWRLQ